MGVLDSAQFFSSHEKINYLALRCTGKLSRYQAGCNAPLFTKKNVSEISIST